MKKTLILLIFLISVTAYSQVGINTEEPKATLDVVASPDDANKIDGVIAPRLTGGELQSKNTLYGAEQVGTIIYATTPSPKAGTPGDKTINVDAPGYYYFNGSIWVKIGSKGFTALTGLNVEEFDFTAHNNHEGIDYFEFQYVPDPDEGVKLVMPPADECKDRIIYIYNMSENVMLLHFQEGTEEPFIINEIGSRMFPSRAFAVAYASDGERWYSIAGWHSDR